MASTEKEGPSVKSNSAAHITSGELSPTSLLIEKKNEENEKKIKKNEKKKEKEIFASPRAFSACDILPPSTTTPTLPKNFTGSSLQGDGTSKFFFQAFSQEIPIRVETKD